MSATCSVYLFGYPHGQYGHVVKVGISNNVFARLAAIQSHNPDVVIPHFSFDLPDRQMAYSIEQKFHRRFSHCGIRGEWFGMSEHRALFMLSLEVLRSLSSRYSGDELRRMREWSGLLRAFAILDQRPDEDHEQWNAEWTELEEALG